MDVSRYNMAPVLAARSRLRLAQQTQRAVGLELISMFTPHAHAPFKGQVSLIKLQAMQREAFHTVCEARAMLVWLEQNNIQDVCLSDEVSLAAGATQRAQVERAYAATI